MAKHLRQQIRERAASTLTGLSTTGSNVFQSRFYPLDKADNLPCILIYTENESINFQNLSRIQNRELELIIEGIATGIANLDDTLDTIGKEIEIALQGDIGFNSLAYDSFLDSTEIQISNDGQQPIGKIHLKYTVFYQCAESAPDTAV